ncbi:MAG: Gldg family protein [Desulfofustis sp.]|jgi:ABC-2 type transport system permease protein|nr:Gldg family protein [Desulfofustis sp.]
MKTITRIVRKEFAAFFSSPAAFIFLGTFLAVNLFIFFWVETFFSTNIAEVRALFVWMPILLILLTAAITMRSWSEERRAGTIEFLLTAPVSPLALVLGKFIASLGLVGVALMLTLPLPVTVSLLGPLDWGPVIGGYLATLFLAAAYISIGLFVSVKSENQLVSLITTTIVCTLFYLIGSDLLVAFFGNRVTELLQLFGSGSRFQSITRGVIDLRDLYYYLSIMGVFLTLNVYGLEKLRWADNPDNRRHRAWRAAAGLLMANAVAANLWLAPIGVLRTDLTEGSIYSISETTRNYLRQLKEPLLIRGYFSPQTHPLLAPLVPRLRDLLEEYAIAGGNRVRVEFIDPLENPELEQEAGQRYGIRPVPFQTASKYQSAVTNSYFHLLIQYGDQFEILSFRDLIDVKVRGEEHIDVDLGNPEYDITRTIKKVLYNYQGGGDLFTAVDQDLHFTGYLSLDTMLPEELVRLKAELYGLLDDLQAKSRGRLQVTVVDPDAEGGTVARQIEEQYGFRPMALGLFDPRSFWFYLTLSSGDQTVEIPLPDDLSRDGLKRSIDAGVKRFASGLTKTIALHAPSLPPEMMQFGMTGGSRQFVLLKNMLTEQHRIVETDLQKGQVPAEADLLLVSAPDSLNEKQIFAVDQFLMKGGTVIVADSPYNVLLEGSLAAESHASGLNTWLAFHGIGVGDSMVLDPQNSSFPVPVERNVGGFTIQETRLVNYPYFVDIRPDGMNQDSGITSGLNQVTMNWASPISIDQEKNRARTVTRLLESSPQSWTAPGTMIQPNYRTYPDLGFKPGDEHGRELLAVAIEGTFSSYFVGKPSPLLDQQEQRLDDPSGTDESMDDAEPENQPPVIARQIDKSPETARIILFASRNFLDDTILGIGTSMMGTGYFSPLQLVANSVDWSLEDRGLLEIRGRSQFARSLLPLTRDTQLFWEYLNYGLAFAGLLVVWLLRSYFTRHRRAAYLQILQQSNGRV